MAKLVPVQEALPSLPEVKNSGREHHIYGSEEMFGFDTETTTCGKKELRSYQAAWLSNGKIVGVVLYLDDWYSQPDIDKAEKRTASLLESKGLILSHIDFISYSTLDELRKNVQLKHEYLIYNGQERVSRRKKKRGNGLTKWKRTGRKPARLACAFNANFDLGVMADSTVLKEYKIGKMEGAGCHYIFRSGKIRNKTEEYGLDMKCLYLGADNVPTVPFAKRGELWDIQAATRHVWGCPSLRKVGEWLGIEKLEADFNDPVYGFLDSVITLMAAIKMSEDLKEMGFAGVPDRFISGATASKDLLSQYYTPFFLNQDNHEFVWPAYFGGMTGAVSPQYVKTWVENVKYGDLDGAYSESAQKLKIFDWYDVKRLSKENVVDILQRVEKDPMLYWKYGSLHIRVKGDFNRVPIRVSTVGDNNTEGPKNSEGLVWARMVEYETTLTLGDYIHSEPQSHEILGGLIALSKSNRCPDLFKMCADERKKYPKFDEDGNAIKKNWVPNRWWKLAGNCIYGSFCNRNGKDRTESGKWFNSLIASSITGAIRHAMWLVNEATVGSTYYNDTDSALTSNFEEAQKASATIGIGFSNKTNEELENCHEASIAVIQGSKRYAMMAEDGTFGAKCHGLGAWWANVDGVAVPLAHDHDLLRTVWQCCYPLVFGEPDEKLKSLPVFHRFSVRTQRTSQLVKKYAMNRHGLKLRDLEPYGKAGNFGFLAPQTINGKTTPYIAYTPQEAADISSKTLETVALMWFCSVDKKYDYKTMQRWCWKGDEVRTVQAIPHTQELMVGDVAGDISIEVVRK